MIVVKKQPFTRKDRSAINYWARQVDRYYGPTHEIIEIYPENEIPGIFTSQVNKFINNYPDIKKTENNKNNSTNDFSVVTDDKPFPWSVDIRHRHIKTFLYKIAGLALVIVLGILIYWQVREKTLLRLSFFSDGLYFGLIGVGIFHYRNRFDEFLPDFYGITRLMRSFLYWGRCCCPPDWGVILPTECVSIRPDGFFGALSCYVPIICF